MIETKSIPPISAEAIRLRDYLKTLKEGETASDLEISKITGRTKERSGGMVRSAIRSLERSGIVLYRIKNTGWRRVPLNCREVVDGESVTPLRVQRMVKRSLRRLAAVRFDELSNEDKIAHCKVSSMNGVIAHISTSKSRDRLEAAVIGNGSRVETAKLLELFK